jgi:hypothetical protein
VAQAHKLSPTTSSSPKNRCRLWSLLVSQIQRLEKFAVDNRYSLTTETVLKFIEKTDIAENKNDEGQNSF